MSKGFGSWQILTGEYPPQMGGVADYSRQVAGGLAIAGADVHVWAPQIGPGQSDEFIPGVTVHREAGSWSHADLDRIGSTIDRFDTPRRILLQYAPNAFSRRGLNFGLARWLAERRMRGDSVRVMFHEVTYITKPGDRIARRVLAFAQRRLAARLLRAADFVDVAIPYWNRMLRPLDCFKTRTYTWLPVMSNVPVVADSGGVAEVRRTMASGGVSTTIGSFGTFASDVAALLAEAMIPILSGHPERKAILIGRGSDRIASEWARAHPELAGRIMATGACSLEEISRHLQACDLLIQPYPGGACSKRGSLMAGISHGLPIVTNSGEVMEPSWTASGAIAVAPDGDSAAMVRLAEELLADPVSRARLGASGLALYEDRFALRRTIDVLIDQDKTPTPAEVPCV